MKKRILLLFITVGFTLMAQAEEVILEKHEKSKVMQSVIPIHVDITRSLLSVNFLEANKTFLSVIGPDGVVYQREITTNNVKSIYIDLATYEEGQYTISFIDAKGDMIEGEFLMKKE